MLKKIGSNLIFKIMRKKYRNRIDWLERDVWELNNPPRFPVGTDVIYKSSYGGIGIYRVVDINVRQEYVAGYTGKTFWEWVYVLNNCDGPPTECREVKEHKLASKNEVKELFKNSDG